MSITMSDPATRLLDLPPPPIGPPPPLESKSEKVRYRPRPVVVRVPPAASIDRTERTRCRVS
jgi:hypothetical protein